MFSGGQHSRPSAALIDRITPPSTRAASSCRSRDRSQEAKSTLNDTRIAVNLARPCGRVRDRCTAPAPQGGPARAPGARRVPGLRHAAPAGDSVMEACGSAHYWASQIEQPGHHVVLLPPHHLRPLRARRDGEQVGPAQAKQRTRAALRCRCQRSTGRCAASIMTQTTLCFHARGRRAVRSASRRRPTTVRRTSDVPGPGAAERPRPPCRRASEQDPHAKSPHAPQSRRQMARLVDGRVTRAAVWHTPACKATPANCAPWRRTSRRC